jgi:hypothetical protein
LRILNFTGVFFAAEALKQKGGDYVQKHLIYHTHSRRAHFCHSKYAGRRIPIPVVDFYRIQGIDAVWYAGRRSNRRIPAGISETQAATKKQSPKIVASR